MEENPMNKIRIEKGEGTTDMTETQWTIPQSNENPRRNGQILRNIQSPKTESGRNRKYEQANYQYKIKLEK